MILIGVVISIISEFLKDYISKILSRFSSRYKSWREKRIAAHNRHVRNMAKEFGFIIDTRLKAIFIFMSFFSTVILMALITLMIYLLTIIAGIEKIINLVEFNEGIQTANTALFLGAIFSLYLYFRGLYFLRLSNEARKIYKKNNFPGARRKAPRKGK